MVRQTGEFFKADVVWMVYEDVRPQGQTLLPAPSILNNTPWTLLPTP